MPIVQVNDQTPVPIWTFMASKAASSILVLNTDDVAIITLGGANVHPGDTSAFASLAPGGTISLPGNQSWYAICDQDSGATISVSPDGSNWSPDTNAIANAIVNSDLANLIALAIVGQGIPIVANPVPLYNISGSAPGNSIPFGTNNQTWAAMVAAGVTGMKTSIAYLQATDGTNGIPTTWPGGGIVYDPAVVNQVLNCNPDFATTISGANDARWTAFCASAPANSWVMPKHEANIHASGALTATQIQQLDQHLIPLTHAANPTMLYGRGVVCQGQDPTPFVTPGGPFHPDFFGMDGYQGARMPTPDTLFGPNVAIFQNAIPGLPIHIIETNTVGDVTAWFDAVVNYAIQNGLAGVESFWGTGGLGQAWQNSFAAEMNKTITALSAVGQTTGIPAGTTITPAPLPAVRSPVAGYATAMGISYDVYVNATAGASSTIPWIKIRMHWFDNDDPNAQEVSQQAWMIPMGNSASAGTKIQGTGPQRGIYLKVDVVNEDTVACTNFQMQINSTSRQVSRDNWRWEINSSPIVPTYTKVPDNPSNLNDLGAVQARSVPASGSLSYLLGLYAGRVWFRAGTNAGAGIINVTLTPQPSGQFNNAVLINEPINSLAAGGGTEFTSELILPRAPCLLTFTNNDTSSHQVFAQIITED